MLKDVFRIAFVSGKLGDVDGVSLETDKWIEALSELGHEIYTIAGYYKNPVSKVPAERQILLERMGFNSPEQRYFEQHVFPYLSTRPQHVTKHRIAQIQSEMEAAGADVANHLFEIIRQNRIDVIIAENTNAMPMSLLGGIAVYRLATIHRVATIFHHHDFWWERSRFGENYITQLLNRIMPPSDLGTEHVVISSYAAHILKSIKRVNPYIIPNCENFDNPVIKDEWNSDFRDELGFSADDLLIVQPTRIVPRKRIEDSVRLVGRFIDLNKDLAPRIKFIISLYQGDEADDSYVENIKKLAHQYKVPMYCISDRLSSHRGRDENGKKLYSTRDILCHANLVTYLPIWEGFGNAFLEAVACRAPIITTTYLVYKVDIQGAGFKVVEIRNRYGNDGSLEIPESVFGEMRQYLTDLEMKEEAVEHNFNVGKREFGLSLLKSGLERIIDEYEDEIKASRRRLAKSMTSYFV